jgi:hypothetical protein
MIIRAQGQLRHRFWGEYSASVVLKFGNEVDAVLAQTFLDSTGFNWESVPAGHGYRHTVVDSAGLEELEKSLSKFGDVSKMASLERSIDYGDVFDLAFEIENPNQLLFIIV